MRSPARTAKNAATDGPLLQRKPDLHIGEHDDAHEREADRVADAVAAGCMAPGAVSLSAFTVARRTRRIVAQNMAWAVGYNLLALPLAAAGWIAPWMAAIGMSLSSLLVVGNSLRLSGPGANRHGEPAGAASADGPTPAA